LNALGTSNGSLGPCRHFSDRRAPDFRDSELKGQASRCDDYVTKAGFRSISRILAAIIEGRLGKGGGRRNEGLGFRHVALNGSGIGSGSLWVGARKKTPARDLHYF